MEIFLIYGIDKHNRDAIDIPNEGMNEEMNEGIMAYLQRCCPFLHAGCIGGEHLPIPSPYPQTS